MRISDWSSDVCSSDRRRCDQSDVETASGRIANIADQPISSLSTALGQITAADSLGIVGEAFGDFAGGAVHHEIGRASWRARVCQYVSVQVVAASFKKKQNIT